MTQEFDQFAQDLAKGLMDQGRVIEVGYQGFVRAVYGKQGLTKEQNEQIRNAFFAGAAQLFSCIIQGMTPDTEPTEEDYRRLDNISKELNQFQEELVTKIGPPLS